MLLISASGATCVSLGIGDAFLDVLEAALGGESEAAFVIPSPTGEAGDVCAFALAEPVAEGVPILFTLPSGELVGVRGVAVIAAMDAHGAPRALSADELERVQPRQLHPHVLITLGTT